MPCLLIAAATHAHAAYRYPSHRPLMLGVSHCISQPQDVQDWLRDVCKTVVASGGHNSVPLADWAPVVTDAFPAGEPDRIAHLRTQDFGDSTAVALPPEVDPHPVAHHSPLSLFTPPGRVPDASLADAKLSR